ncbi:MAG: CARDB domain-containing protein [Patescibacteria group bacterium]
MFLQKIYKSKKILIFGLIFIMLGQFFVSSIPQAQAEELPDLIIESFYYRETNNNLYAGYTFDGTMAYLRIKNQGSATATNFEVGLYTMNADTDYLQCGPAMVVDKLESGESKNIEFTHDSFFDCAKLENKEYYLKAYVDYNDKVDESDEDNNIENTANFTALPQSQSPQISNIVAENISDSQTRISFEVPGSVNPIVRWAKDGEFSSMSSDNKYKHRAIPTNDGGDKYQIILDVSSSLTYHYRILFDYYYNVTTDDLTFQSGVDESDLIISKIRVIPRSEDIYNRYQIGVTLKNIGDGNASITNSLVTLTYGTNFFEIYNCELNNCRVGNKYNAGINAGFNHLFDHQTYLMPGEEKEIIFNKQNYLLDDIEFDNGVEYLIKAVTDAENSVDESNENNNSLTNTFIGGSDSATCTDSDGGKNYYQKGTSNTFTDYCFDDGIRLREFWCNGNEPATITYECPNGCKDGACIVGDDKPDLIIEGVEYWYKLGDKKVKLNREPKENEEFYIYQKIKNIGAGNSDLVCYQEYLDNKTGSGGCYGRGLSSGESFLFVDDYAKRIIVGKHQYKLILDPNNFIDESNENNNEFTKIIIVKSSTPAPTPTPTPSPIPSSNIAARLSGRLLLAVEDKGRIHYVNPDDSKKYEVTFGNVMKLFEDLALGISNNDLNQILVNPSSESENSDRDGDGYSDKQEATNGYNPDIPSDPANRGNDQIKVNTKLSNRLMGKLLLQVEDRGRIWYIDQAAKRWEVTFGNVMNLFTSLALGITNQDLSQISAGN